MATIVLRASGTGLPAAPTLTAVQAYDGAIGATWTPQGTDVAGFIITATSGGSSISATAPAGVTTAIVDGLTNGLQYEITVVTRGGSGLLSAPSGIRVSTPRATLPPPGGGDPDPGDDPTPLDPLAAPLMQAFPVERAFHPENWLLTQEEADARG